MKCFHAEAYARLEFDDSRLQSRLDAPDIDKFDGVVHKDFFERKNAEWRNEQRVLLEALEENRQANHDYVANRVQLLELASHAAAQFECKPPADKRRMLGIVLSNSS